jgi:hypothetical protein
LSLTVGELLLRLLAGVRTGPMSFTEPRDEADETVERLRASGCCLSGMRAPTPPTAPSIEPSPLLAASSCLTSGRTTACGPPMRPCTGSLRLPVVHAMRPPTVGPPCKQLHNTCSSGHLLLFFSAVKSSAT